MAFDSYWSVPNSDGTGENVVYRFGSVGQVQLLFIIWLIFIFLLCSFWFSLIHVPFFSSVSAALVLCHFIKSLN